MPKISHLNIKLAIWLIAAIYAPFSKFQTVFAQATPSWAQPATDPGNFGDEASERKEIEEALDDYQIASQNQVRQFHEVLDELLAEFGHDVRNGGVNGLKNLSIRKVTVNENLPRSYEEYIEMLVNERIRENSKIRLISCIPCKTKSTQMVDGRLLITSPRTNTVKMADAAQQMGIENFMDVVLLYHSTHMVLAFQIFDTQTKEQVWARAYNSETIRSRFQKLAVDYSQVDKSRNSDEYVPEFKYLFGFGGAGIPNVGGDTSDSQMLLFSLRGMERFNNRRSEFGLQLQIFMRSNALLSEYPDTTGTATTTEETTTEEEDLGDFEVIKPEPFTTAFSLMAMYAHNFMPPIESYNDIRHGINFGLGPILAAGYFALTFRLGYDLYFGRRFAINFGAIAISPSNILIDGDTVPTAGGFGGDLSLSYNF